MRGLEEIIHENNKIIKSLETQVSDLEVQKRILEERISDMQWDLDRLTSERNDGVDW